MWAFTITTDRPIALEDARGVVAATHPDEQNTRETEEGWSPSFGFIPRPRANVWTIGGLLTGRGADEVQELADAITKGLEQRGYSLSVTGDVRPYATQVKV